MLGLGSGLVQRQLDRLLAGGGSGPVTILSELVYLSSPQTINPDLELAYISWDGVVGAGGFWSAGAPTRFTIPSGKGIVEVLLTANIRWEVGSGDNFFINFDKNGSSFSQGGAESTAGVTSASSKRHGVGTLMAPVVPGDYFQFQVAHNDTVARDVLAVNETWMSIIAIARS